jgi:hypothetical protein
MSSETTVNRLCNATISKVVEHLSKDISNTINEYGLVRIVPRQVDKKSSELHLKFKIQNSNILTFYLFEQRNLIQK